MAMASFNSSSIGNNPENENDDDRDRKICSFCKVLLHEKCSYPCGHIFCGKCFVHFFNKSNLCYVCQLCKFANDCSFKMTESSIMNTLPGNERSLLTHKKISSSDSMGRSNLFTFSIFENMYQYSSSLSHPGLNDKKLCFSENKTFSPRSAMNFESLNSEGEVFNHLPSSKSQLNKVVSHLDVLGNCSSENEYGKDGLSIESNGLNSNLNRNQLGLSSETNSSRFPNCTNLYSFHKDLKCYCITCGILFCLDCLQIHMEHNFQHLKDITVEMVVPYSQETIRPKHVNFKEPEHNCRERETVWDSVNKQESNVLIKMNNTLLQPKTIIKKKEALSLESKIMPSAGIETLNSTYELNSSQSQISDCQEKGRDGKSLFKLSGDNLSGLLKTDCAIKNNSDDPYLEVGGQALDFLLYCNKSYFFVELRNHLGKRIKFNGNRPKVILKLPSGTKGHIKVNSFDDIFYTGCIYTNKVGKHVINISLNEMNILNLEYVVYGRRRNSINDLVKNTIIYSQYLNVKGWGLCCSKDGTIYATDTIRNCIWAYNSKLKNIDKFGRTGKGDGEFLEPCGITIDELARIIVVDKGNHRIQVWTRYGKFLFSFGGHGNGIGKFDHPWGVATNSFSEIAVTDSINGKVHLFGCAGNILDSKKLCANKEETDSVKEFSPQGLCFYEDNTIFVLEIYQHYIHRLQINRTSNELIHCQIIEIIPQISNPELLERRSYFLYPIKEIQGILITEGYMVLAETELNRIILVPMDKFDETINNTETSEDSNPCQIESKHILPIYDDRFRLSNIAVCQDGHLLANNSRDQIIYKLRG